MITIHHCDVQWQSGANNCGLFAVAFATALCTGHDPAGKVYDQSSMRGHLLNYLLNRRISPFLERSCKRVVKDRQAEELPIFCICRLPDDGKLMVQCSKCTQWYHQRCIQIPHRYLKKNFYCKYC